MTTEHKTKLQFDNTPDLRKFISAINKVDVKSANNLQEDIDEMLESVIDIEAKLINNEHYDVTYIMETYENVQESYVSLYNSGTTDSFVRLLNKCGSLTAILELIDDYIFAMRSKDNQDHDVIDDEFRKKLCDDDEFSEEFHVIHLGLFSLINLLYPRSKCGYIKFIKMNIFPIEQNDMLVGIKFVFRFDCKVGDNLSVEFEIDLTRLRRCLVLQSTQYMDNQYRPKDDWIYCNFQCSRFYEFKKSLEYWKQRQN